MEKNRFDLVDMSRHDDSYIMNACYDLLTRDIERTLDVFIIFEDEDFIVEIPKGKGYRSVAIDKIIDYFIKTEEYEKCAVLKKLKEEVIKNGD